MLNNEKAITLFAVSSVRTYCNGELYHGTDAIFLDADQANVYIQDDMRETLETDCADDDQDELSIDYEGYTIDAPDHGFGWLIEPVKLRLSEADQIRLRQILQSG